MINKVANSLAEALDGIEDGATILIGGFGGVGQPDRLIQGVIEGGASRLTIVCNNVIATPGPLPDLIALGRVDKVVCSFLRGDSAAGEIVNQLRLEKKLALEIVPQGTLAERLRAAGAGIAAFFTRTGVGSILAEGREHRVFGKEKYLLETALHGDVALIEAWAGDRWGNLRYRGSGANFNAVMASAARTTVASVHQVEELGHFRPDEVGTPGIYVNRILLQQQSQGEPA